MSPRWSSFVLVLSAAAMACADTTSPVAPVVDQSAAPLPSLTWRGADGPRTATLVGTDIVFENGVRIAIDTAAAKNFRRLAVSMPKMEALAQRMAPVWAKMGLPTPTSTSQASAALTAFRARAANAADLRGVLMLTSPIEKPMLVAECDPVMQFCGFDSSTDPSDGGSGGSGGSGSGSSGPCERIGLMLYQYIAQWRSALSFYDQVAREVAACQQINGSSWPTACWSEILRLSDALLQLNLATYQMEGVAQTLRALGCM